MFRKVCSHLSYANVMATLAVFLGLGGGAYAASGLIGADARVHACVDKRGHAKFVRARAKCNKGATAIAWSQRGPEGVQGISGAPGVQGIKGDQGDQGIPGPGAMSFDKQFPLDENHVIADVNGVRVRALCNPGSGSPFVGVFIQRTDMLTGFFAFGTKAQDGVLSRLDANADGTPGQDVNAHGAASAELDVVAGAATASGGVTWNRFDLSVIQGTVCNFHGLIIPGVPAG